MRPLVLLLALLAACSTPPPADDAGARDAGGCDHDDDCQDGVFCNGRERCRPGDPAADELGCVGPARMPCPLGLACTEAEGGGCLGSSCTAADDADGDGVHGASCGGDDCDDDDPERFPGNDEVCDDAGHDEDCDPRTAGDRDADGDDAIDAACCDRSSDPPVCGDDCDDGAANVNRRATEACDGFDNDCDGATDEGVLVRHWPDADDDGFGDASATPEEACSLPTGRVDRGGDCDESSYDVRPFGGESCNTIDDDCDGTVDEDAHRRCEEAAPGTIAECLGGACVVTGCAAGRFDCNDDDDDGCEIDLCRDPMHCSGCGRVCPIETFTDERYCVAGSCAPMLFSFAFPVTIVDDVTGAPIAGAAITMLGECTARAAVTTNASGEADLEGGNPWYRVTAAGYPTHVLRLRFGTHRLVPQSVVDAWRADPDLGFTPSPSRSMVVLDFADTTTSSLIQSGGILGAGREAVGSDLVGPAGDGGRAVYLDAVPGRMTIGGDANTVGCAFRCTPEESLLLLPGALTRVADISCSGVCS